MNNGEFVNYYELLQISPNAELETIQRVYRLLANRYHPDNSHTGDPEMFVLLNDSKEILADPESRAEYDAMLQARLNKPLQIFSMKEFAKGIDGEGNRRMGVLCLLYNRRRIDPDKPGVSVLDLETTMSCPREHLMFALWYLLERNLVRRDENSNYVVTGEGADYVETHLPKNGLLYRLLKSAETGHSPAAGMESERPQPQEQ